MSAAPVIVCRGLAVAYGGREVLSGVDLAIPRGALLPVVGPNGAGKSTLLKALLGLVPSRGEIRRDFGARPPAYVPQRAALDPLFPLTVRDLVAMGLYPELGPWRRAGADGRARIAAALDRFGIAALAGRRLDELSGGQFQKALLARAVVSRAEALFLDEPTSGLDAASEKELLALLRELNTRDGRTVVWVHHRLDQCAALAAQACFVDGNGGARIVPVGEVRR